MHSTGYKETKVIKRHKYTTLHLTETLRMRTQQSQINVSFTDSSKKYWLTRLNVSICSRNLCKIKDTNTKVKIASYLWNMYYNCILSFIHEYQWSENQDHYTNVSIRPFCVFISCMFIHPQDNGTCINDQHRSSTV